MRQAIQTKFIGPTNTKGSRVKAWADAGALTLSWNHRHNPEQNHKLAAETLARKLGWSGVWNGGSAPGDSSGYVFVLADETAFTVYASEVVDEATP